MRRFILSFVLIMVFATGCSFNRPANTAGYTGDFLKQDKKTKVVVFVHGVLGNDTTTWGDDAKDRSWPKLMKYDGDFIDQDIYVARYYSPAIGHASNINEIAVRLHDQLMRKGIFDYDEICFITHSMGGLVAKRVLVMLDDIKKLRRVKTVIFLATPSHGAPVANVASWLSLNRQFIDLEPTAFNTFLQSIEVDWQRLLKRRDEERAVYPLSYCAYETLPTAGLNIVPELYTSTKCDDTPYPIDLNHIDIAKPQSIKSDQYQWAANLILNAYKKKIATNNVQKEERTLLYGKVHLAGDRGQGITQANILLETSTTTKKTTTNEVGDFVFELNQDDIDKGAYITVISNGYISDGTKPLVLK